jgi:glyoxylase-like metal-dependent hydrolase (beta-lactamase superfamily II)
MALKLSAAADTYKDHNLQAGKLPKQWSGGLQNCKTFNHFEVHAYNNSTFILRQSRCLHFEKPFLFLLIGTEKALLLDTGAVAHSNLAKTVQDILQDHSKKMQTKVPQLVVSHLHTHDDHTAGDKQFDKAPNLQFVKPSLEAAKDFFGIKDWPNQIAPYELGDRTIDIIPIPGHDVMSVAVYDRNTGLLLTGDSLYPGRLYINTTLQEFRDSTERLVKFTQDKPVVHILGTHIENKQKPYTDYPIHTRFQPEERALELGRAHLLELLDGLNRIDKYVDPIRFRDFTICGKYPSC